jgi:hypothetical protein
MPVQEAARVRIGWRLTSGEQAYGLGYDSMGAARAVPAGQDFVLLGDGVGLGLEAPGSPTRTPVRGSGKGVRQPTQEGPGALLFCGN